MRRYLAHAALLVLALAAGALVLVTHFSTMGLRRVLVTDALALALVAACSALLSALTGERLPQRLLLAAGVALSAGMLAIGIAARLVAGAGALWLGGWFACGALAGLGAAQLAARPSWVRALALGACLAAGSLVFALTGGHAYLLALRSSN